MPPEWYRGATRSTTPCRRRSSGGWARYDFPAPGRGPTALTTRAANRATARFRTRAIWLRSAAVPPSMCGTSSPSAARSSCRSARAGTGLEDPPRPVQWLAGGWQLNTIGTFLTGLPFTPTMQTNNLNTGTGSQFPNRIASGELPSGTRTIDRWFDASAFVAPAQYVFGNCGTEYPVRPRHKASGPFLVQELRVRREPAAGISRGGVQRVEHAAVQ